MSSSSTLLVSELPSGGLVVQLNQLLTRNNPSINESQCFRTVFARLIVDGKDYGVKPFVVPLRNPETFDLLPGVAIGDIGMKMGRNSIDNGWMQFTYCRIPRSYRMSTWKR